MFGDIVMAVVIGAAAAAGFYLYLRQSGKMSPQGPVTAVATVGIATAILAFLIRSFF